MQIIFLRQRNFVILLLVILLFSDQKGSYAFGKKEQSSSKIKVHKIKGNKIPNHEVSSPQVPNSRDLQTTITSKGECYNNNNFYPLNFGDSDSEMITSMHIIQSQQDSDNSPLDKEDWIAVGGHSKSANVVGTSGLQKGFMILFQYIGGIRWGYYDAQGTISSINSVKFTSNGLQVVFLSTSPIHLLVFNTISGQLNMALKFQNYRCTTNFGLETRLQSSVGIFLAFQNYNSNQAQNLIVMELNQTDASTIWALQFGDQSVASSVREIAFTGTIANYERLYVAGRNGASQNVLAIIDPSSGKYTQTFQKLYAQNSQDWQITHLSVFVNKVAFCGDQVDSQYTGGVTQSWASYGETNTQTDEFNYMNDFMFDFRSSSRGYCGGVYVDNSGLYALIITDKLSAGQQIPFVYKKDFSQNAQSEIKAIEITSQGMTTLIRSHAFQVKSENGAKTFFIAGSINDLGQGLQMSGGQISFIEKFWLGSNAKFTCIPFYSPSPTISDILSSEGTQNSFLGSDQASGSWYDITLQIRRGGAQFTLESVSPFKPGTFSLQRIESFRTNQYKTCISGSQSIVKSTAPSDAIYYVGQSAQYFSFKTFTYVLGQKNCTDVGFTFFAEIEGGRILPTFIQLDSINRIFQVHTTDQSDAGSYKVTISGYSASGGIFDSISWKLTVKTNEAPQFVTSPNDIKQYYYENKRVQLPQIKSSSEAQVYISVTLHDELILPEWIDYNPNTYQLQIFPQNQSYVGEYELDVVLTESIAFLSKTYTISLMVVDSIFNITNSSKQLYFDVEVEVTQDAWAYIKFGVPVVNYQQIQLSDEILRLRVVGDAVYEDDEQIDDGIVSPYYINYTFQSFNSSMIVAKLDFKNPSEIGLFINLDKLEVTFDNNKTFYGVQLEMIRNTSMTVYGQIPRLVSYKDDEYEEAELIAYINMFCLAFLLLSNLLAWILVEVKLIYFMRLILVLQVFEYTPLFYLSQPTMTYKGLNRMAYSCFQILRDRSFYGKLFDNNTLISFNSRYSNQNIQSDFFLTNFADILVISIIIGFCFIFLSTIGRSFQAKSRLERFFMRAKNTFNQNLVLNFFQLLYLPIVTLSSKSLSQYTGTQSYQQIVSQFIALSCIVSSMLFFFISIYFVHRKRQLSSQDDEQLLKFQALHMNLKLQTAMTSLSHIFWHLRSSLFAAMIVFMESYPKMQVSLFFTLCTTMQLYLMIYRPYIRGTDLVMALANDTLILLNTIFYFFFTDMTLKIRPKILVGWCLLWMYSATIALNGFYIFYQIHRAYRVKKGKIDDAEIEEYDFSDDDSRSKSSKSSSSSSSSSDEGELKHNHKDKKDKEKHLVTNRLNEEQKENEEVNRKKQRIKIKKKIQDYDRDEINESNLQANQNQTGSRDRKSQKDLRYNNQHELDIHKGEGAVSIVLSDLPKEKHQSTNNQMQNLHPSSQNPSQTRQPLMKPHSKYSTLSKYSSSTSIPTMVPYGGGSIANSRYASQFNSQRELQPSESVNQDQVNKNLGAFFLDSNIETLNQRESQRRQDRSSQPENQTREYRSASFGMEEIKIEDENNHQNRVDSQPRDQVTANQMIRANPRVVKFKK